MNQPKICVINQHGRALMPTTPRKARVLLKDGRAKIVGYKPFTIQLMSGTRGYTQPVTLGIDAGFEHIGFSAITEKEELLGGELTILKGMTERITERRKYRVVRRNRLRHRAPRFDNRRRREGWLAPSIQHKYDAHLKLIERIKSRLPVTEIVVEVAPFDIQKINPSATLGVDAERSRSINNPDIQGTGYQEGEQLGYSNLTSYIRHRDNYKCCNPDCKNKGKEVILQIHHLGFWKNPPDRSNRPANLITLCTKCHTPANHKKGKLLYGWQPKVKSFKPETFMSIIYRKLIDATGATQTFGYITKHDTLKLELPKSHHNDAFVIASGINQTRAKPLILEQVRRNKRSMEQFYDARYIDIRDGDIKSGSELSSGRRTRNKKMRSENLRVYRGQKTSTGQRRIKRLRYRYSPGDLVQFEHQTYQVIGMQNKGLGVKLKNYPGIKNKVVPVNKVQPCLRRGGICEVVN